MENISIEKHKTAFGDYPKPYGEYLNQDYPQIPCLVFSYFIGIRYFNVTEQCWDDEDCDDYCMDKNSVDEWVYLDDIIKNINK